MSTHFGTLYQSDCGQERGCRVWARENENRIDVHCLPYCTLFTQQAAAATVDLATGELPKHLVEVLRVYPIALVARQITPPA